MFVGFLYGRIIEETLVSIKRFLCCRIGSSPEACGQMKGSSSFTVKKSLIQAKRSEMDVKRNRADIQSPSVHSDDTDG